MSNFDYVKTKEDLFKNILHLEKVRRSKSGPIFESYANLIKNGQSFITYPIPEGVGFAPTRFMNVKNNSIELHELNKRKMPNGGLTSTIVSAVGFKQRENSELFHEYIKFCNSLGIDKPSRSKKAFWNNPFKGDSSLLSQLFEVEASIHIKQEAERMARSIENRVNSSGRIDSRTNPERAATHYSYLYKILVSKLISQAEKCALCGGQLQFKAENLMLQPSPDRIDSENSNYEESNLQITHLACNLAKNKFSMERFEEWINIVRNVGSDS